MNPREWCRILADELNVKRLAFRVGCGDGQPIDVVYDSTADAFDLELAGKRQGKPVLAEQLMGAVMADLAGKR